MKLTKIYTDGLITIEKIETLTACQCGHCLKTENFPKYAYNNQNGQRIYCRDCLRLAIENDIVYYHDMADAHKVDYASRDLYIRELHQQQRNARNNIIDCQDKELKLADFMNTEYRGY